LCYLLLISVLLIIGYMMNFTKYYYYFLTVPLLHLFIYQIRIFNLNKPSDCLIAFKSNNLFGLLIFVNILIGKIF